MSGADWSRHEVEAIVADHLSILASKLSGSAYSKTAYRQALRPQLNSRLDQSIEYKHASISAALLEAGFPYISGYKARSNYQGLLAEVVAERLSINPNIQEIAAFDADRPMVMTEVEDILSVLTEAPQSSVEVNKGDYAQRDGMPLSAYSSFISPGVSYEDQHQGPTSPSNDHPPV